MSDYDPFAADYDAWSAEMTEDVAWYVGLAREAGEPVVELAVGSGRVAIPIARETGKRVIGIDRSPAMLAVARERAQDLPVELREGDIRELELEQPVDLVICPFRAGDETTGVLRLWWVGKAEWEGLIDVSGLEVEALYGGSAREPFSDESLELVWVARKPA